MNIKTGHKNAVHLLLIFSVSLLSLTLGEIGSGEDNPKTNKLVTVKLSNRTSSNLGNSPKPSGSVASGNGTRLSIANALKHRKKNKDKKTLINKKLKTAADPETLEDFIRQVDKSGLIRRIIRRKIYIPEDSTLELTSQVSRPNIFPNIFNQGEGFIVDAVVEWVLNLDLHKFGDAMQMHKVTGDKLKKDGNDEYDESEEGSIYDNIWNWFPDENASQGKSLSVSPGDMLGFERCFIYEKVESAMSLYLDISRNQSRDCVLRAVCEAQLVGDYYPEAPSSVFFEVLHLVLKPSLSPMQDSCYTDYLTAERAAYKAPLYCSSFVAKCPLNIAGLFVRNFFPEIL